LDTCLSIGDWCYIERHICRSNAFVFFWILASFTPFNFELFPCFNIPELTCCSCTSNVVFCPDVVQPLVVLEVVAPCWYAATLWHLWATFGSQHIFPVRQLLLTGIPLIVTWAKKGYHQQWCEYQAPGSVAAPERAFAPGKAQCGFTSAHWFPTALLSRLPTG
jgi:hypothetical protein